MSRRLHPLSLAVKKHIDDVCLRFEAAWQQTPHPAIEPFLEGVAEPEFSALLAELLLLDLDYRIRAKEAPEAGEFAARFPDHGQIVEEVFRQSGLMCQPAGTRVRYFGDYELLEVIGRGGMGVVYKARQLSLDRIVALKMIRAGRLALPDDVDRFHREARMAAGLQHPNIVAIHEVGEHDEQHYFSMDYVEGTSLAEIVRQSPLGARQAALYLKAVAEAVHYAHQRGTLHRDLKPSNVILDSADQPRITDFGLARRSEGISELTASGQILGTPSYMSPEQAAGDLAAVGPASDVYSLGATLYDLVTGRPPFRGETAVVTLRQVLDEEPVPPRRLNPVLPRDVDVICLRCIQKDPKRRYGSAQELADDLGRFLRREPIRARPVGPVVRLTRWCRRKPLVAGLVGALILALLSGTSVSTYLAIDAQTHARDATERLWESYLAQARARRYSGRPGRRVDSLEVLASAAAIRPTLELRNEAIACMALVDLRVAKKWEGYPPGSHGLAFDAKLERYCVSDAKGNLSVRSVADNQEVMRLSGPGNPAWVVRFSPSGRWLAAKYAPSGQNKANRVWVWDLTRGAIALKTEHPVWNTAMVFSPDDRLLAAGHMEGGISLYDLQTGRETRRLPTEIPVAYLACCPDGTQLAAWSPRGTSFVCSADDGRVLHVCEGESVWHPSGNRLAVIGPDSRIRVYDAETWQEQASLEGQLGPFQVTFAHGNDLLAAAGGDHTLRLWHSLGCEPLLSAPDVSVIAPLVFSPDDRWLGHRVEGTEISLFEVIYAPECRRLIAEPMSSEQIWETDVSPDGRWLAGACDDGVRLWDLASGEQTAWLPSRDCRTTKFTPDGMSLVVSGWSGLWRRPIARDGPTAAALRIGPAEPLVLPEGTPVGHVSLSRDGCTLAAALPDAAVVFDLRSGAEKARFAGQRGLCGALLSPDARWLACCSWNGSGLKLFDLVAGKAVFSPPDSDKMGVQFSPDGRWLLTAIGPEFQCWSVGSFAPGLRIARQGTGDLLGPAAFAPDGRILAALVTLKLVRLIDFPSGRELATLEAPDVQHSIATLSFTPDGSLLIAASRTRMVHVWDLRLVRQRLATMGLDWDLPPYAPADASVATPLRVDVVK